MLARPVIRAGVPRRTAAQDQKAEHMKIGGSITDRCAGAPCHGVP